MISRSHREFIFATIRAGIPSRALRVSRWITLAGDRNIDIDDLVAGVLPDRIRVGVAEADGSPVRGAAVRFYPVRWYTYAVIPEPQAEATTDRRGYCAIPVARVFEPEEEFGVRYCNCLVDLISIVLPSVKLPEAMTASFIVRALFI